MAEDVEVARQLLFARVARWGGNNGVQMCFWFPFMPKFAEEYLASECTILIFCPFAMESR